MPSEPYVLLKTREIPTEIALCTKSILVRRQCSCDQSYITLKVFRLFDLASKETTSEGPAVRNENKALRTLTAGETHEYAITEIPSSAQVAITVSAHHRISRRAAGSGTNNSPSFVSCVYDHGLTSISTAATSEAAR